MSERDYGTGQIVTATFADGEDHTDQDCIDNECFCECHDSTPTPEGTYITVRLDDPDVAVGLGRVNVQVLP